MRLHFCGARIADLYHYEVKGKKTLRMIFEGEDDEERVDEVAIFLAGPEIDLLKEKLGPRNITRFAPACVDCTVAQAKHFKFCPWCGESLK